MQVGRILIADDNPLVRACLANLLEKWGLRFTLCGDGQEAWEYLQENKYDMLLIDLQMPKMDGHEVVNKLRKNKQNFNSSIPIVAIAGSNDPFLIKQIKKTGVNTLVFKPFEPGALFKVISKLSKIPIHQKVKFFSDEFDMATLDSLYGGDQDHFKLMLKLFLKNTPPALRQMRNAMKENDLENLEKVVHKMKPTFTMVGLTEVTKQAQQFEEKMLKSKKTSLLTNEYKHFSKSIEKALKVISVEHRKLMLVRE